jgi:hypothetical protein
MLYQISIALANKVKQPSIEITLHLYTAMSPWIKQLEDGTRAFIMMQKKVKRPFKNKVFAPRQHDFVRN